MKALLMALKPKGKELAKADSEPDGDEADEDYKQIAKDAAKDGDWDAVIDALCAYIEGH